MRITTIPPLVLAAWHGPPDRASVAQLGAALRAVGTASGLLNVIVAGRPVFSNEGRDAVIGLVRDVACDFGVAHVVLMRGVPGAAVRLFLNGVLLVARPSSPTKVFDVVDPALAWLGEQGCDVASPTIATAIAALTAP